MKNIPRDDDHELWWLLSQARHALSLARKRELKQYHLSSAMSSILLAINAIGDKATPADIARWIWRQPHSVFVLLRRMEKNGLVTLNKDLHRKNLIRVALTSKGREAYAQSLVRESIHNAMSSLSEEDRQKLRSCMYKLWDSALKEHRTNQSWHDLQYPPPGERHESG
tara:strand:+ start:509 stop:1012 length:504 start_codon:yes stop_codon:yes gene_type:complete